MVKLTSNGVLPPSLYVCPYHIPGDPASSNRPSSFCSPIPTMPVLLVYITHIILLSPSETSSSSGAPPIGGSRFALRPPPLSPFTDGAFDRAETNSWTGGYEVIQAVLRKNFLRSHSFGEWGGVGWGGGGGGGGIRSVLL